MVAVEPVAPSGSGSSRLAQGSGLVTSLIQKTLQRKVRWDYETRKGEEKVMSAYLNADEADVGLYLLLVSGEAGDWLLKVDKGPRRPVGLMEEISLSANLLRRPRETVTRLASADLPEVLELARSAMQQIDNRESDEIGDIRSLVDRL